jgi:hypothetical protein
MRKTIRLTGRRQLPVSAFDFQIAEVQGKRIASLSLIDPGCLKGFAANAEIRVKIVENKLVEILRFGTVGKPTVTAELEGTSFLAPSCQIRVVASAVETEGMLLGSTKNWTYKSDGQTDGILLFQPSETAPRAWKLELREEEYPILYVDHRIPDAAHWARTDAVFSACVLPHVIGAVFQHIFEAGSKPEDGWMAEWIGWAATLIPANPPPFGNDIKEQRAWVDVLTENFSAKHKLADQLIAAIPQVQ